MTDRHAGYIVTLGEDVRCDEDEHIVMALQMVKGVVSVTPVKADYQLHMAADRVRFELQRQMYDAMHAVFDKKEKT